MTDETTYTTERVTNAESALDVIERLDIQSLRWELKQLREIEKWAKESLRLGFDVGDVVTIVKPYDIGKGSGWYAYREMLGARAAQGVVSEIKFNASHGYWYALVRYTTGWSTSDWQTETKVYPFTHSKSFMINVTRLKKVRKRDRTPENVRPIRDGSQTAEGVAGPVSKQPNEAAPSVSEPNPDCAGDCGLCATGFTCRDRRLRDGAQKGDE